MVSRTAASTRGRSANRAATVLAARSSSVRTLTSGSRPASPPNWFATSACHRRSFCRSRSPRKRRRLRRSPVVWRFRLPVEPTLRKRTALRPALGAIGTAGFPSRSNRLPRGHSGTHQQGHRNHRGSCQCRLISACKLAKPITGGRRTRHDRLVVQVMLDILGKLAGRLVTPSTILLHRLHHDPVELAADHAAEFRGFDVAIGGNGRQRLAAADFGAGLGWLLLADDPQHFVEGGRHAAVRGQTASRRSAIRTARRPANRCRCAYRCPADSAPPARDSCTPACRRSGRAA